MSQTLRSWFSVVKQANKLLDQLNDEALLKPIAPGKNSGYYLLGHLTSVSDFMQPLLGIGDAKFPELKPHFIRTPDNHEERAFSILELKDKWQGITAILEEQFNALTEDEWMQKHTMISEEDFAKEPHRNRLNVLMSRTNHMSYHLGQLVLLKE